MRGRLATVIKRAALRFIFGETSGSKRLKEWLETPWLSRQSATGWSLVSTSRTKPDRPFSEAMKVGSV